MIEKRLFYKIMLVLAVSGVVLWGWNLRTGVTWIKCGWLIFFGVMLWFVNAERITIEKNSKLLEESNGKEKNSYEKSK